MRIFLLLSFLFLISCSSQHKGNCDYITDYYPHTAKAEIAFYKGNYQEAFDHYHVALRNCEAVRIGMHYDTDKLAKICAELGKDDLALDYVEETIEKGGPIRGFQNDTVFRKLFESERGKKIVVNFDQKRKEYLSTVNLGLRAELQKMEELDQKYNMTKFKDSMFQLNDKRLVEIFEEYGYPNEQVIGDFLVDHNPTDPEIMLMHSGDSIRINYFFPKLKKYVQNGTCPPLILGNLYDNLELFNGNKFTHGTYTARPGQSNNWISDTAQINLNRAEVGLPSLAVTDEMKSLRAMWFENR